MENSSLPIVRNLDNVFLIDWLTVVFHGTNEREVRRLLSCPDLPFTVERQFRNGYPLDLCFENIHIRHGADRPEFYDDPSKARSDMGVCLDMSGKGCRCFESWSTKSWYDLISDLFVLANSGTVRVKITRLDLAYDDHVGLLNIWRMRYDVEDRNYISKSKKSMLIWSDDQEVDIQGLTIQIGSKASPVLIRIYDKAAERGYKDRHWVRVELQLRQDRAQEALHLLYQHESIGMVASGIIRNYCMFVTPTVDSNKARWPIAEYWQRVLEGMEKLRVWHSAGEEYNFSKTENYMISYLGQALITFEKIHGSIYPLLDLCKQTHTQLKPKYHKAISAVRSREKSLHDHFAAIDAEHLAQMRQMGFGSADEFFRDVQVNFAELLDSDPDLPFGG